MAKEWSWSWSKYEAYQTCPKRFYECMLQKNYVDTGEALVWGREVHVGLANAAVGKAPLPPALENYQQWIDQIKDPSLPGKVLVEQQLAITRNFQPTSWFADNTWMRAVVDFVRIDGPVALSWDWKTGKIKHNSHQLMISSQALFSHYPGLKKIKTEFVWLKEGCKTPEIFDRSTIVHAWPPILEGVKEMEQAAKTLNYPPKPNRLCRAHCPVISCPFFGKAFRS